jgi:hypothetical protein
MQRSLTSGARGGGGQPNPLAGQCHLTASHGLASQGHSPRGGRGESQAEGRWSPNSMVDWPCR